MRRPIILSLLFLFIVTQSFAQIRVVRGAVKTESGEALPEATITTDSGEVFSPKADGTFELRIPSTCKALFFTASNYSTVVKIIDGSYLLVLMSPQKKQDAEEARLRALQDSIDRVNALRAEEERARRDSIETAYRLRAEEEARLLAEKRAEQRAIRKERRQERIEKIDNRSGRLIHAVRVSYAYQDAESEFKYAISGYRSIGSLQPTQLDYTLSYKINHAFSVGAGVGLLYNLTSIESEDDKLVGLFNEKRYDLPVYATASAYFGLWKMGRPTISVYGGYYPLSRVNLLEGMVGLSFLLGSASLEVGGFIKTTPYPFVDKESNTHRYGMAKSPGVSVRLVF